MFVDEVDIRTLVSAQTYVVEDSGLVIRGALKARDEAVYTCSAINVVGRRSMTAHLTVYGELFSVTAAYTSAHINRLIWTAV